MWSRTWILGCALYLGKMLTQDNEGLMHKAKLHVEKFCKDHMGAEVKPVVHVTVGHPADEIAQQAEDLGVDLLVVGTHAKRGLDKALFGSVCDQVLRLSPVPVFCVNPQTHT